MENWLTKKKQNFSVDSQKLFDESIMCYKIKAHRASLLFSYLGFLTIIKEVIIPKKIPEESKLKKRWENILKELNDEDKWEKRVFEELTNSSSPIFNISDSIREQIKYWKGRRNDCAHFKENEINSAHVEMFWSFLKSNLPKITIEGGKLNLLKKFAIHFDDSKTSPDKDYVPLIKEIENAVEHHEMYSFFEELSEIIFDSFTFNDKKTGEIYSNIFTYIDNVKIKEELIRFIKSKTNFDLQLIREESKLIFDLKFSSTDIRTMWKRRLFTTHGRLKYYIYAILLRNNMIPVGTELKEAMKNFYDNFNQDGFNNIPDDLKPSLVNNELLETVYDELFVSSKIITMKYTEINSKADLVSLVIEFKKLDLLIVKGIFEMYTNGISPWWLTDNINELFKRKSDIKDEFKLICSQNNLDYSKLPLPS
jgi:hypothetical protein